MRLVFTIVCTIIFYPAVGQYEMNLNENQMVSFEEVIPVPGADAAKLYALSEKWIAYTFTYPEYVRLAKIENEFLRGHGLSKNAVLIDAVNHNYENLYFKFEIRIKDEKVLFILYDIQQGEIEEEAVYVSTICFKDGKYRKNRKDASRTKESVEQQATKLFVDLKQYLKNPASENDW
jgi:hypothetical protein